MPYHDESRELRIQIQTQHCHPTPAERAKLESDLHGLRNLIRDFPVADLHVEILLHPHGHDYHVKTSLRLPGRTIFTGDRDPLLHPAYERCVDKLVNKVKAYKEKLNRKPAYERAVQGAVREVWPELEPDPRALERAVEEQDYVAFREAMAVYDDALQARIGRWIQRYPRAEALVGDKLRISDFLEEVNLNAFEYWTKRPAGRLGNWLEKLIDPSIRVLVDGPETELENLSYIEEISPPDR